MYFQPPIKLGSPPVVDTGFARIARTIGEEFGAEGSLRPLLISLAATAMASYLLGWLRSRSRRVETGARLLELERSAMLDSLRNLNGLPADSMDYSPAATTKPYSNSAASNTAETEHGTAISPSSSEAKESGQRKSKDSGPKARQMSVE